MHTYDASDGHIDGAAVARKVGMDPAKVFKTLVTRGHSGSYLSACCRWSGNWT